MVVGLDITKLKSPIKVHKNCTVIDVGSGAFPRYIEVRMPGPDGARRTAEWNGFPALSNSDTVICHEIPTSPVLLIQGRATSEDASADQSPVTKLVSPDLSIDPVISANNSGNVTIAGTGALIVPDQIVHSGDTDTYVSFAADQIDAQAGGVAGLTVGAAEIVVNEGGADLDFRVEGDTDVNLLFVDAGNDRVGIGTSGPSTAVDVNGDAASDDLYLRDADSQDDTGTLGRIANSWRTTVADHFGDGSFSGYTWASYTGFVTPGNITEGGAGLGSVLRVANTATEGTGRAFAYVTPFSDASCRCAVGRLNVRTGLRMDDGTDDNYAEIWLSTISGDVGQNGTYGVFLRYSVGGSVTGPTQQIGGVEYPVDWVILRLIRSGDNVFAHCSVGGISEGFLGTMIVTGWTPARVGLYHEHQGGSYSNVRCSYFDWFDTS